MIGKVFVSFVLAGIFFTWLSVMKNAWTSHVLDTSSKIFVTVILTALSAFGGLFVHSFIPTSAIDKPIPPSEYDYVKSEQAAVYLHGNDYQYTEDAYLHQNAGDSSKVKLTQTSWNNIEGETIGTTINLSQK